MKEPGLDDRHRDRNGEISRKHGNTLVHTLRTIYGPDFARAFPESAKLSDVLHVLDEQSLAKLVRDHNADSLGLENQAAFLISNGRRALRDGKRGRQMAALLIGRGGGVPRGAALSE